MPNIIDYVVQFKGDENCSFREKVFCEADALIFAQLAYLSFEGVMNNNDDDEYLLSYILGEILKLKEASLTIGVTKLLDNKLIQELIASPRFKDVKIKKFKKLEDENKVCQFTGVTFILDDGTKVISYRGTIQEKYAWRESLDISHLKVIPSQKEALKYLKEISQLHFGNIILVGHSKGGNIAMYAAINSSQKIYNRILKVYNFDGPGFNLETDVNEKIPRLEKIETYMPQSSFIGILLNHYEKVSIVKSVVPVIFQHDPYSIQVENCKFIYLDELSDTGKYLNLTMKNWLSELNPNEVKEFLDTIDFVLTEDKNSNFLEKISSLREKIKAIKEDDKENFDKVISLLKESSTSSSKIQKEEKALIKTKKKKEREVQVKKIIGDKLGLSDKENQQNNNSKKNTKTLIESENKSRNYSKTNTKTNIKTNTKINTKTDTKTDSKASIEFKSNLNKDSRTSSKDKIKSQFKNNDTGKSKKIKGNNKEISNINLTDLGSSISLDKATTVVSEVVSNIKNDIINTTELIINKISKSEDNKEESFKINKEDEKSK